MFKVSVPQYARSSATQISVLEVFHRLKYGKHYKRALNISTRKVGGLRFIKVGRFTFMFCISREYKAL